MYGASFRCGSIDCTRLHSPLINAAKELASDPLGTRKCIVPFAFTVSGEFLAFVPFDCSLTKKKALSDTSPAHSLRTYI